MEWRLLLSFVSQAKQALEREISSSHSSLMMEAVRTSETSVDNHFTRQYNPEDSLNKPLSV
jgi:hypothetical protein